MGFNQNENLLGRNIQHFRQLYGETLEELGNSIFCAKSTVKGYENGSRMPDPNILKLIAMHYGITEDMLIHSDLTGYELFATDINSMPHIMDAFHLMIPCFMSMEIEKNENFRKAYELTQRYYDSIARYSLEMNGREMILRIMSCYLNAMDDSEAPEIAANLLWCVFMLWVGIKYSDVTPAIRSKMLSKKLTIKDMRMLKATPSDELMQSLSDFISTYSPLVTDLISALKNDLGWPEVADYYLALSYMVGLVDNDLSPEMNAVVGNEMLFSLALLGNTFACNYLREILPEA